MGFYAVGEQPAPRCKSPVPKCFARLVAARCGFRGEGSVRYVLLQMPLGVFLPFQAGPHLCAAVNLVEEEA